MDPESHGASEPIPLKRAIIHSKYLGISRFAILLLAMIYCMVHGPDTLESKGVYAIGAAFFMCSTATMLEWVPVALALKRWVLRLEVLAALGIGIFTYAIGNGAGSGIVQVIFLPLIITAGLIRDRAGILAVVSWAIVTVLGSKGIPPGEWLFNFVGNGCLMLFGWGAGSLMNRQAEARERSEVLLAQVKKSEARLGRAHKQLLESARKQMEMAALEERQRVARDMHDGVAHRLTALLVQLQVGQKLMEKDPGKASAVIGECVGMAREALMETRLAVRALKNPALEGQSLVPAISKMAHEFGRATGLDVGISEGGEIRGITASPAAIETVYRVVQEAMTNAYRHGRATKLIISLSSDDAGKSIRLGIDNNGMTPEDISPGVGLYSMRERVEGLGGEIVFSLLEPGFRIIATIPADALGGRDTDAG